MYPNLLHNSEPLPDHQNLILLLLHLCYRIIPVSYTHLAAEVDGATSSQVFWQITLPLLRPILVYVVITSLIGGLQLFDVPQILTNGTGDPMRSTMTLIMFLNKQYIKPEQTQYGNNDQYDICDQSSCMNSYTFFQITIFIHDLHPFLYHCRLS